MFNIKKELVFLFCLVYSAIMSQNIKKTDTIVVGQGCFWCGEAIYQRLKGVISAESGYSGGEEMNPTYQQVCSGKTKHIEVIRISFNPHEISLQQILQLFFYFHDPTSLNKQGNDVGYQYRSVIFFNDAFQQQIATQVKEEFEKQKIYSKAIVTDILPLKNFYLAEPYHQNYYNDNMQQPYCQYIIRPKVDKLEKLYKQLLK